MRKILNTKDNEVCTKGYDVGYCCASPTSEVFFSFLRFNLLFKFPAHPCSEFSALHGYFGGLAHTHQVNQVSDSSIGRTSQPHTTEAPDKGSLHGPQD